MVTAMPIRATMTLAIPATAPTTMLASDADSQLPVRV